MNSNKGLRGRTLAVLAALLVMGAVAASPVGADNPSGFRTTQPSMITTVAPGVSVTPLMTVGERLRDYELEAIPDGISLSPNGQGTVDVYLNHETSLVPFPFNPVTGVGQSDFTNSLLSRLRLNQHSAGVLRGDYVISDSANYQRFCSNFLAGAAQGFERDILLTNEEASDFVNRTGQAWPPGPNAEQAGVVVAYDVQHGTFLSVYSMGRMNHENDVAVPGYGHPVVLTGDDTFSAPSSQLYMATAASAGDILADNASLWAFKSNVPSINDYGDLSGSASVSGQFIPVPEAIARGGQSGLESWSNANNVFQFIRVEDIAYDRTHPNVVYFADTGEPRAIPDPTTGRLRRGPAGTRGPYMNGRVFKLVLDPNVPTQVESLSILIDADLGGYDNPASMHQPDNLETTEGSLLIQEDPGSHNQYAPGNPLGTTARIWADDLDTGHLTVLAKVNQATDPAARQGEWESSGIIDASQVFGPGAFLLDVQAHTIFVRREQRGPLLFKQEGGQLLLLRVS